MGRKMKNTFLKKLKLENFRCYENTSVTFNELNIIVGENNAGKSCLIEALRLVATAAQEASRRAYQSIPKDLNQPAVLKGFEINTQKQKIDLNTAINFYRDTIAKITAFFAGANRIEIYINRDIAFAVLYDGKNNNVTNKNIAKSLNLNKIGILPQIGLIRENEKLLSDLTIKSDKDTYLTSLHFRNEVLHFKNDFYDDFKELAESSWDELVIQNIEYRYGIDEYISLFVADNRFTAEIGKMGSGLKMWLQIMWFLARTKDYEIVILDEPDVYMHADLQRKLLDIVKSRYAQIIIATHSFEVISRVDAENILSINKKTKEIKKATDKQSVQKIIDEIGGMQNLSLIRLGKAKKCLFVEGKDLPYLNRFNEKLFGKNLDLPVIEYGGYAKLSTVYGASKLLYSETDGQIKCYAIADKDYKSDEDISNKIKEAANEELLLHIWKKKEIENYLINLDVIYRIIVQKNKSIIYDKFVQEINAILEEMKDEVIDQYSEAYKSTNKAYTVGKCNQYAREEVKKHWGSIKDKIGLVNGKDLLGKIRIYCKDNFDITLTDKLIQDNFEVDDIDEEMKSMLAKLN